MISSTLNQALENSRHIKDSGVTFIRGANGDEFLSYNELYSAALRALFRLQEKGIQPRQKLVFQLEDNKDFIILFWACILGGIIPVPISIGHSDDHRQKLFNVLHLLDDPFLAISKDFYDKLIEYAVMHKLDLVDKLFENNIVYQQDLFSSMKEGCLFNVRDDDIAFIQFSSGSTGVPKGVVLSHKNLITNMNAISIAAKYSTNDVLISWMPLTHDMGLIGFHLNPLLNQINHYLIPTSLFIRRPSLWLDKVHQYQATVLSSLNFGLKYTVKHSDFQRKQEWNFSRVRIIFNGAEPISKTICQSFITELTKFGLRSQAMCPVYGLAEATLAVSISRVDDNLVSAELSRNHLNIGNKIVYEQDENLAVSFLNVGKVIENCSIRITDNDDFVLQEEIIGHIQIRGTNVTRGYYCNKKETEAATTPDKWFRTGDLGFIKQGALYITGRSKDVIFLNGQNLYSHDIESVAEELEGIELNKICITSFFNLETQLEETIAFVLHRTNLESFIPIIESLRSHINHKFGFELDHILPVKDIPRTTSGKLQRFKLLEEYKLGSFSVVYKTIKDMVRQIELNNTLINQPENEIERKLVNIWKGILRRENINVDDDFYKLGGNSLKIAELQMHILKEFSFDFALDRLYTKYTVRSQAHEIEKKKTEISMGIPSAIETDCYELSFSQKRIYYAWEIDKTDTAYNIPVAFIIRGILDEKKLEQCIQRIIDNHSSLRMSFIMKDEPYFVINENINFRLIRKKISDLNVAEQLKELIKPFNLRIAPLFNVTLLEKNKTEHIIFLDFHHIISDGVSIYNFINEMIKLYEGLQPNISAVDYKDYSVWNKNRIDDIKSLLDLEYWRNQLKGDLPLLEVPTDFNRPSLFETKGNRLGFEIDKQLTAELRSLASDQNCGMHVLILSLYFVLLFRYSKQNEFIIGIPVSGRSHPELWQIQGMFVNNLAIRANLDKNWSFLQMLTKITKIVSDALAHADCPFDEVVRLLDLERDVSRNPLFDTMFIYQNMGMPDDSISNLNFSRIFFNHGTAKFDLSMEAFEVGDTLRIDIEYSTSLFQSGSIEQMLACFRQIVHSVIEKPQTIISKIPLLTEQLYNEYIQKFNSTVKEYHSYRNIYELIEKQARNTPDHVAIDYKDNYTTYSELIDKVEKVSFLFRKQLEKTNGVVGLLFKRSTDMIVCMLAVLKAGGCYLPLDSSISSERLKSIITDSKCCILLSDTTNDERLESLKFQDENEHGIIIEKGITLYRLYQDKKVLPLSNLAYIIYTSGSTGTPKGVMIGHQQLLNYVCWAANQYVDQTTTNFPLFTSLAFDLTITSIFTPLITGNTIVIYDELSPILALGKVINENKVQVIKLTPSHLSILNEFDLIPSMDSIRRFIVGGEQLSTMLATQIYHKFHKKVEIYNEYGPTEATVGSMIYLYSPNETTSSVPIGLPIANTQIYLLDESLNPVPNGMPGEIYIGGKGLAEGYLYNIELSEQLFVANPFNPKKKVYKTGDMARRTEKGVVEYIGRLDSQVKINGYRVELFEIEKQLICHKDVKSAVVLMKTSDSNQASIYAYYIPKTNKGQQLSDSIMRQYCKERLPYYMIPNFFIAIDYLPLTSNGKVDHRLLPDRQITEVNPSIPPSLDTMAEILLSVWRAVFNMENIMLDDDFFYLGGDSIKAVQISAKLFELGITLNTKDILLYHTINKISMYAKKQFSKTVYEQGILTGSRELLPAEFWFFSQKFKNPNFYNQSLILRLNQKIDKDILQNAFKVLIEQHDGLRTNYNMASLTCYYNNEHLNHPFIIDEIKFNSLDWNRHISQFDPQSRITTTLNSFKSGFDITDKLLLKAAIISISDGTDYLFITAHHLVVDGVSWRIILTDLLDFYTTMKNGDTIKLPPKTAGLIDWSNRMQDYIQSKDFLKEKEYWNVVHNHEFILPLDKETTDWRLVNQKKVILELDEDNTKFLSGAANLVFDTDVSILLNTALILTLNSWLGPNSYVVEQENHGRHLEYIETSRSVGWFTAIYPIYFSSREMSIGDLIKCVKQDIMNVPRYGIGGIASSIDHTTKRCQIRFNYLGTFYAEFDNAYFSYCFIPTGHDSSSENEITAVLEFNSMIVKNTFSMEIGYNSKTYHEKTIETIKNKFEENVLIVLQYLRDGGQSQKAIHFKPSDFTTVALDQNDLDILFE